MTSALQALLALGLAALAHVALRRVRRRLSGLARRRRREGRDFSLLRVVSLGLVLVQWGGWLAALGVASRAHPLLIRGRETLVSVLTMALESPLFSVSERPITALDLILLPCVGVGLWLLARGVTHVLRASLLRGLGLEGATEQTVSDLLRYGLLFAGSLVALQLAGVDVRGIAIAGGVLGVGIGFGLQNIANNFVSGVLIGFERPIRPGDFVRVGEYVGTVIRVGPRSTTIRTLDRVSIVVPNSRFLETEVVNWSLDDPTTRVHVPVGVAYGSEVSRVRAALLAAARTHPSVLREPRPQVQLRDFGSSAPGFELLAWTRDPKNQFTLISDLNYLIQEELARHGVTIPFSQVDLHVRTPEAGALVSAIATGQPPPPPDPAPPPRRRDMTVLHGIVREDRSPEEWTLPEIEAVLARLAGREGVVVADRRHFLRVHPDCFVGAEAVDWLEKHEGLTRAEARALGERMLELGFLRHVLDEHGFLDGHFFYRFEERAPAA